jgi:hypothetical protein
MIARVASVVRGLAVDAHPSDGVKFCVDQNALARACVVTPSVGALRSFVRRALYVGGVAGWEAIFFG